MAKEVKAPEVAKAATATEANDAHEAEISKFWDMLPQAEKDRVLNIVIEDAGVRTKKIHDEFDNWLEKFDDDAIKYDRSLLRAVRAGIVVIILLMINSFASGRWGIGILNAINIVLFVILHQQVDNSLKRHMASKMLRESKKEETDGQAAKG